MAPAIQQSSQPRGTPPRAIWPHVGGVLSYYSPRQARNWLLLPDTFASRLAAGLRVAGVFVFLIALVVAFLNYDEYDRANQRLAAPFNEQRFSENWSRPTYVAWRRAVSLDRLRYCAWTGLAGASAIAAGTIYEWRRRRRVLV